MHVYSWVTPSTPLLLKTIESIVHMVCVIQVNNHTILKIYIKKKSKENQRLCWTFSCWLNNQKAEEKGSNTDHFPLCLFWWAPWLYGIEILCSIRVLRYFISISRFTSPPAPHCFTSHCLPALNIQRRCSFVIMKKWL